MKAGTKWCWNENAMHLLHEVLISQKKIYIWEGRTLNHRTRENAAWSSLFLLAVSEFLVVGLLCFIAFLWLYKVSWHTAWDLWLAIYSIFFFSFLFFSFFFFQSKWDTIVKGTEASLLNYTHCMCRWPYSELTPTYSFTLNLFLA